MTNTDWIQYWKDAVKSGKHYFGSEGENADLAIEYLDIKEGDRVLEIGCGNGAFLTDIANKVRTFCCGYDISPVAVGLCKDKRLLLEVADMEESPYISGLFNKVISFGVFEHSPRTDKVFAELARIMEKDGLVYFTVPNKLSFFHIIKNIRMIIGDWGLGYERGFTRGEIKRLMKRHGFVITRFYIIPHRYPAHIFNRLDNLLNKISNRQFGFFIHVVARKI